MAEQPFSKCQVYVNDTTGRYVKASDYIKAGETILVEEPIIVLPSVGDKRCSNCLKFAQQYCSKCKISPLCLDCQQHNDFNCEYLAAMPEDDVQFEILKKNPDSYVILKCLLLYEDPETRSNFEAVMGLESHLEERRNTPIWKDNDEKIVQPLMKSNILKYIKVADRISEDFLQRICATLDINAFEIRAPDTASMRGVYVNASMMDHQCTSNVNVSIDDQYRLKVYANRDIDKEEMVTNCYTNVLLGTEERRHILLEGKYFYCRCPRCEDPTELGSHMSSLVCAPCAANNHDSYIVKSPTDKTWQCLTCSHSLKPAQVENILERVKEEVFHAQGDLRRYEILLAKLTPILHQNHYIMVDLKQSIANILRSIIMSSLQRPGRRLYERKVRLCQELMMVLQIILPGLSRLKSIALYELANASAELVRLRFGEKELTQQELQGYLRKCESMLKESVRMLLYEPTETPEGQLARSIMAELKDLRNDIQLLDKPLEQNDSDE